MATHNTSFKGTISVKAQIGPNMATSNNLKDMPEVARRALEEADERRKNQEKSKKSPPKEVLGRDGPDPVRFGDWEKDGIISDF